MQSKKTMTGCGVQTVKKLCCSRSDLFAEDYPWDDDLVRFMHVLTAALVVHCEDASVLRRVAVALVDIVVHFGNTFLLQGYNLVLPTMLCVSVRVSLDEREYYKR